MPTTGAARAVDWPALLTRAKEADGLAPGAEAVTTYPPGVSLALKGGATAIPLELVVAVAVAPDPAKLPEGPDVGALKVTVTPGTGLASASVTVTERGTAKASPTGAAWSEPSPAVMV